MVVEIQLEEDRWRPYINQDNIEMMIHKAIEVEGCNDNFELSLCFMNDKEIQVLNKDYRGKDKPTNVLSFPNEALSDAIEGRSVLLGDIVLSFETIQREAAAQGKKFMDHTTHMIIHGFLHLLGYDHTEAQEAEAMEAQEIKILEALRIANPYEDRENPC